MLGHILAFSLVIAIADAKKPGVNVRPIYTAINFKPQDQIQSPSISELLPISSSISSPKPISAGESTVSLNALPTIELADENGLRRLDETNEDYKEFFDMGDRTEYMYEPFETRGADPIHAFRFDFIHTDVDEFYKKPEEKLKRKNGVRARGIRFIVGVFHTDQKHVGVFYEAKDDRLAKYDIIVSFKFFSEEVEVGDWFGVADRPPAVKRGKTGLNRIAIPKFFTWDEYMSLVNADKQVFIVTKLGLRNI